jgi:pyruvate/2-oxoglutarate dehydrogenase complex dihydrolipoamide acyltransferase (E2) component
MASDPRIQAILDSILRPIESYRAQIAKKGAYAFGPRDYPASNPHVGVDFNYGGLGQSGINMGHKPVYSPAEGVVTAAKPGFFALEVYKGNDAYSFETLHMQTTLFHEGQTVHVGDQIGTMGGVGADDVQHVHIQARDPQNQTINPLAFLYDLLHPTVAGQPAPPRPDFGSLDTFPPKHGTGSSPSGKPLGPSQPSSPLAPPSSNAPLRQGPAALNRQPPTLPADKFSPPPTAMPRSNVGPPLDLTPFQFRNPPASRGGFGPRPDPTGSLYFSRQSPPRQFGPFLVPGPGGSGTDILRPRNGSLGNSSIPMVSAPGQVGNGSAPAAAPQTINGNAADQAGGGNDIGGAWTTARQYMGGQTARMPSITAPADQVPTAFPENGAQPIGYLNDANQTGTFDPAAPGVPRPRPRPPQAPAASWPIAPVAPLLLLPQAGAAAPEHPDWHDAGDWPQEHLPSWPQPQPPTENTFPASPNGVRGLAGAQPPASQRMAPQPALPVQNLTTHVLRMKGVPEADIAAAINDPETMQGLLNQLYGRRSMIAPGDASGGFGNGADRATSADQPAQVLTPAATAPENYLPFGWYGLQALLR